MTGSGRKILSQGDCDSACFLYALANASIVLTEQPAVGNKKWDDLWNEATDSLLATRPFLRACTGTAPWDDQNQCLEAIASKFLGAICKEPLEVKLKEGVDRRRIGDFVSETSVVVLDDGNHWYVVVETDGEELYVACSARLNEVGSAYQEKRTPSLHRLSNNCFPLEDCRVYKRKFFVVSTQGADQ